MTRPRSTSSPSDALGATIANQSARTSSLETVAHRHAGLFGRGVVAVALTEVGSNIGGITTTPVDIPSTNVQFIADPTRLYKVTARATITTSAANDTVRLRLTTDTGAELRTGSSYVGASVGHTLELTHLMTASGLTSLKLQLVRGQGSGTMNLIRDNPVSLPFIIVEDVAGLPSPYVIVGGASSDVFTDIGGTLYRVVTWTASGSLEVKNGDLSSLEYLIVAGGGGGGGAFPNQGQGAGGGAGGLLTNVGLPIAPSSGIYTVTIGAGGTGSTGAAAAGNNGADSSAFGLTAFGGGGGGNFNNAARVGGSGGGGGNNGTGQFGAAGIAGQGFAGGRGSAYAPFPSDTAGAGGGGAIQQGGDGFAFGFGGVGGAGFTTTINGSSLVLASGGGGGGTDFFGLGPTGGGGNGGQGNQNGFAGTANTGGGGGGASDQNQANRTGGTGGSGIIIVRFPYSPTAFQP